MPRAISQEQSEEQRRIGLKLKSARLAAGLSQANLGSALGVTFQQIQKYERGTNRLSAAALQRVCEHLDVSYDAFLVEGPIDQLLGRLGPGLSDEAVNQEVIEVMLGFARIRDPAVRRSLGNLILTLGRASDA